MEKKGGGTVIVSIITLLILSILVFLIFRDDYREIIRNIYAVSLADLLLLLAMGVSFQMFESAICFVLVRSKLPGFTFRQAIGVVYLGVFGNVSTFSVGSVPLQSYYLCHCGLAAGSGIGVMTLEYVCHKISVLVYAAIMLLIQGRWLSEGRLDLLRYVLLGYAICTLIILALILLCTWKKVLQLTLWLLRRFPDTEKWEKKKQLWEMNLNALYTESQKILRNPCLMGKMAVLNGLKLFCFFAIPFLCVRMLKIQTLSFGEVQLLSALMYLITNALPNVAGMGPTEFAFILIFSCYMEYAQVSSALILYRVATFFFPFLLSVIVFLIVQRKGLVNRRKEDDTDAL